MQPTQGEPKRTGNTTAASGCVQPETGNVYLCPLSPVGQVPLSHSPKRKSGGNEKRQQEEKTPASNEQQVVRLSVEISILKPGRAGAPARWVSDTRASVTLMAWRCLWAPVRFQGSSEVSGYGCSPRTGTGSHSFPILHMRNLLPTCV